jgi:hypothetical protein
LNQRAPFLRIEAFWLVEAVELHGTENKWPSHSFLQSLLEVRGFVKVELGLGRGPLGFLVLLLLVISGILLAALAWLLFSGCGKCCLPSLFLVLNDFLSSFVN